MTDTEENTNDDGNASTGEYGRPTLLSDDELSQYSMYLHFSEEAADKIRRNLADLDAANWNDDAYGGIHTFENGESEFVMEVPNRDGQHAFQLRMKKEEFKIFHHRPDAQAWSLPVDFLIMRLGGVRRKGEEGGLVAFRKAEVCLMMMDDDVDFG